ncbi:UNVERIFIED_CONTAM: hypothetical protein RMT77_004665 [Armadillidium vulgare]
MASFSKGNSLNEKIKEFDTNNSKRFNRKKNPKDKVYNTIQITLLSNFKEKIAEAKSLLCTSKQVIITAYGPSIPHAINLAMVLQSSFSVVMEISTSTVYQSGDINNGRKFASPSIRISVNLIEERSHQ